MLYLFLLTFAPKRQEISAINTSFPFGSLFPFARMKEIKKLASQTGEPVRAESFVFRFCTLFQ